MTHCIKCGKDIPDGELFCLECSLNPGSSLFEEQEPSRPIVAKGRMQTPQPQKKAPPAPPSDTVPGKAKGPSRAPLIMALTIVSLLLAGALVLLVRQYRAVQVERNRLQVEEAQLNQRAQEYQELQAARDALETQVTELKGQLKKKEQDISTLEIRLAQSKSSQSQGAYDLTTSQKELQELQEEKAELEAKVQVLEEDLQDLEQQLTDAKAFEEKADFLDQYVVFVVNDGSRVYHTYNCASFPRSNFWAYSRKLAEAQGFGPCPICGGQP